MSSIFVPGGICFYFRFVGIGMETCLYQVNEVFSQPLILLHPYLRQACTYALNPILLLWLPSKNKSQLCQDRHNEKNFFAICILKVKTPNSIANSSTTSLYTIRSFTGKTENKVITKIAFVSNDFLKAINLTI